MKQIQMSGKDERVFYIGQIIVSLGFLVGSRTLNGENIKLLATTLGCYIVYFLIIRAIFKMYSLGFKGIQNEIYNNTQNIVEKFQNVAVLLLVTVTIVIYSNAPLSMQDFLHIFVAYLITNYPGTEKSPSINYGVGMACSFFEGYLAHIIPNDGAKFVGFEENITIYEARENVVFPVKKLFIIITKSLYCPPDLKQFNKKDRDIPYLEACKSFEDLEKDVAGVKNRIYRNSAYKIHRNGVSPVYIAAECATPLHTLHRVLERRVMCEVLGKVDPSEIVKDFCSTLEVVIDKSPDCRGKCELVYFDDTDPDQNLAEVLLAKISDLEPEFEELIINKR